MHYKTFNKTLLASSMSLLLGAAAMQPAMAQENAAAEDDVEVIQVTGMRASMIKSMDVKRSKQGVVDAITAEDIGKFPDGNLAESLQRITGVSIDRSNGEGSKITVRGMGPEFNLVTLNGRQMPTAGGRSFDFGDLATESVSAVEVYKTGRADLPTGGIGATVNMVTNKPLAHKGEQAVISAKGVHETSVENGDKLTPEIAGMYSNTFADNKFGVLISGSYQDRNNREQNANVDNWIPNVGTGTGVINSENQRADGATWYPQNSGYGVRDNSRQRTNAQGVLQYEANDDLTMTLDYTYSKVESEGDFESFGIWFNNGGSIISADVNERGTYTRVTEASNDFATNIGRGETERENKSIGFNVDWQATEALAFEFDYHDSSAVDQGKGLGHDAFLIIGNTSCGWCGDVPGAGNPTANIDEKTATFPSSGIPIYEMTFVDGAGNPQPELLPSDIGSLFGGASNNYAENEMDQFQVKGEWTNLGDGALAKIEFGGSRTKQNFRNTTAFSGMLPAGWWNWSAQYWPDENWEKGSTKGLLDDFGNAGDITIDDYFTAPFDYVKHMFETIDDTFADCCFNDSWGPDFKNEDGTGKFWAGPVDSDARVEETVTSLYTQFTFNDEINDIPVNVVAGLRYEEAKVTSTGFEQPATNIVWTGGNEFAYEMSDEQVLTAGSAKTKQFLPSLDVNFELTDDIVTRFSYARTLARPDLGAMRSTRDFVGTPKIGQRRIVSGNPGLQPYIADNLDFSLEYYYDEGSYASVGYFKKMVDNFLVQSFEDVNANGIRDVYNGPRAEEARAQLTAEGIQATDANVFRRINENMGVDPTSPIYPNADDPLAVFDQQSQANGEEANLFGWEFALQHMFGYSGFGVMLNATIVNGDVEADRDEFVQDEFALPGMSDSANFSVFYEDEDWSARVSYNYRDEFLSGFDQHGAPVYTEAYQQLDANVSYHVTEDFTIFAEALNITEETQRTYVRYSEQLLRANQYGARYNIGARYVF